MVLRVNRVAWSNFDLQRPEGIGRFEVQMKEHMRKGLGECSYMRVIVFAKNIQESLINRWPGVVKFCDIGMFKPINEHLATKYQQKRAHNLARPFGEYCEALR